MRTILNLNVGFKYVLMIYLIGMTGCKEESITISVAECKPLSDTCVSYAIPGKVYPMKQPYPYACWATVLAMLYSWKQQQYQEIETVLQPFGANYVDLYRQSTKMGISIRDEIALYEKAGLKIERQLNPSIQGWRDYLADYGPLSLTIDARPPFGGTIHALLLLAIQGNVNGTNTTIIYIDPADGLVHEKPFMDFLKMYEAKMSIDWPIQIIHFP